MELVVVPFTTARRRHRGRHLRLPARAGGGRDEPTPASPSSASASTRSVAPTACRAGSRRCTPPALALADAGIGWDQAQFAFGGSRDGGDADTLVNELGLTGLPFVNVWNGCATGGSALTMADRTIRSGAADLGLAIGFDKHPRGAFNVDPESMGIGALVRRDRA